MEKLEAFRKVLVLLPIEFDYELNLYMAELKRTGVRKTKAQLVMEFARIGFLKEKVS